MPRIDRAPEPMTPPDCDLRGLPFMPLDTIRLLDSDLFALSTGDEFKASLALWCKAWLQQPGGSLPNDERVLAYLSGARGVSASTVDTVDGERRNPASWDEVRSVAMRGWQLCSDGRYYHPVVAEKANQAWEKREKWIERESTKNERQQRWREKLRILSKRLRDVGVAVPEHPKAKELEDLCRQHGVDADVDGQVSTVDAETTAKTGDRGQGKGKGTKSNTANAVGAAKRGTRLPVNWSLPPEYREWAAKHEGMDDATIDFEAAKFADYWHVKPGKDALKIEWLPTWRNWCRNRGGRGPGRPQSGPDGAIGGVRMSSPC